MKPIPTLPKRIGNSPSPKSGQHLAKPPSVPKRIDEVRHKVKLYALMENIDLYKDDKEELLNIIRLVNETRHCRLVTRNLLTVLGIESKSDPNSFTCEELVKIVIFLYEAVIDRDKMFIGSQSFEMWYDPTLHVLHYSNESSPVSKDGVRPSYIYTLSKGFSSKKDAEAMVAFLYSPEAMAEYGIKAIGYRTEGNHTRCECEIKVWLSSARWQQQNELINLLAEEEG